MLVAITQVGCAFSLQFGSCDHGADGSGTLEIDYESEAWVDCYGDEIHDSEEMRRDNPEGFSWDCCGETADAPGCTSGPHKHGGAKRARSSPSPLTGGSATKRTMCVPFQNEVTGCP
jgi:hypothetical protein